MLFNPPALILAVDDTPRNLQLLNAYLTPEGYQIAVASNGKQALKVLEKITPDLILLDIMMPEMDGYQVCDAIKNHPIWKNIPIIFLTAKASEEDILQGFESGGVDYVTKPFRAPELLARIRTQIELKRNRDLMIELNEELRDKNEILETLNCEKDHFLSIASHDLKNPLGAIAGMAEMMVLQPQLNNQEVVYYGQLILGASRQMLQIITNLLDLSRLELGHIHIYPQRLNLEQVCQEICESFAPQAKTKAIKITLSNKSNKNYFYCDKNLFFQIISHLLSNAIKFSPLKSDIFFSINSPDPHFLCFQIQDQGPGISFEEQKKLYQKFVRLSAKPTAGETSIGLGLALAKQLAECLQGQLICKSEKGQGACFELKLPWEPLQ